MYNDQSEVGWFEAQGSHREIGFALGKVGYDAVHQHLTSHPLWKTLNESKFSERVDQYSELTKEHFATIWEEDASSVSGLFAQANPLPTAIASQWSRAGSIRPRRPSCNNK